MMMTMTHGLSILKKLYSQGKMNAASKRAVKTMIGYFEKNKAYGDAFEDLAWKVHQQIGGLPEYEYQEDLEYNQEKTGSSVYQEFDHISHSGTKELYDYKRS
jgi:hypothetical protein